MARVKSYILATGYHPPESYPIKKPTMSKKITAADLIEVYLKKEARADGSEPYTYAIKDFGQKKAKKDPDRYSSKHSAQRSALRVLGVWKEKEGVSTPKFVMRMGKLRRIIFINHK